MEWQTKTLAAFIAATTGKEGRSLQREAQKINLLKLLRDHTSEGSLDTVSAQAEPVGPPAEADTEVAVEAPGADDPELPEWVRTGSPVAVNRPGSAEALLGGFHR